MVAVGAVTVGSVVVVVVTDAPTECAVGEEEAGLGGGCGTSALVVVGVVVTVLVMVVGETRLTCWTDSVIPPTAATAADVSTVVCIDGSAECKVVVVV